MRFRIVSAERSLEIPIVEILCAYQESNLFGCLCFNDRYSFFQLRYIACVSNLRASSLTCDRVWRCCVVGEFKAPPVCELLPELKSACSLEDFDDPVDCMSGLGRGCASVMARIEEALASALERPLIFSSRSRLAVSLYNWCLNRSIFWAYDCWIAAACWPLIAGGKFKCGELTVT